MKIDSWKKANKAALKQAAICVLFCIVYTYAVMFLTGGEEFISKQPTESVINGIRHDVVLIVCGMLAALIPIICVRYTNIKFLLLHIPMGVIYYIVILFLCVLFVIDDNFDFLAYAIISLPAGAVAGTIIAVIINQIRNYKH